HGDTEGGVQPDLGVNTGNDGEGDGLGNQCQSNHKAGENVSADVGKPFLFQGVKHVLSQLRARGWHQAGAGKNGRSCRSRRRLVARWTAVKMRGERYGGVGCEKVIVGSVL